MHNNNSIKLPEVVIPSHLDLTEERVSTLSNGLSLHTLHSDCASVVRLTLVFKGGSSVQSKPFAAASALSMLSEGTADFSATEIAEKLDFYGIFFDNSTDRDYCYLTIASLSKFLPEAIELLQSMVLKPLFAQKEFELYRAKKRQQLLIDRAKPSFKAREAFSIALFGSDHPYGRHAEAELYDALSCEDLQSYFEGYLHAGNCFAVASGDISEEVRATLSTFLSELPVRELHKNTVDFTIKDTTTEPISIVRDDAVQCCLRIGRILFGKSHPDFIPMQLLVTVLGGYFGSRLVKNLRETNGYTYGAYSAIVNLSEAGYIAIASDVDINHTDDAVREIFFEMERLQNELIPEDELHQAVCSITGELMRLIDGPFGIADIAIENIQSSMSSEYLNEFLARITAISAEELQTVACKYLTPSDFLVIRG